MTQTAETSVESLSFEHALSELETIVRTLENGQGTLEESIHNYTRGTKLKAHCEQKLKEAELKVEKILEHQGDSAKTEPFSAE